ncbi:MAG: CapA family protein [Bacteroidales bacterium]|nr:CapA family protein [Bacteroidales bacterium]
MKTKTSLLAALVLMGVGIASGLRAHAGEHESGNADSLRLSESLLRPDSLRLSDSTYRITLLFAGDLMQHAGQITAGKKADGTYDYSECFKYMTAEIERADVAIANFETTLAGPPYTGYPQFCSPDRFLLDCRDAGFDVMLTANNHVCDRYSKGINRTIAVMDSLKVPHLGSYANAQERQKHYPFLLEKNGFRIVLLNYTYGTNGIPTREPCVVNYIDKKQMAADIAKAKTMNPDAIIACMHWGVEYTLKPVAEQRALADWLFKQGVTHIIGGHPHVVEPMEVRTDASGQKHVLVYSLGNFISNMSKANTTGGMTVRLQLAKHHGKTTLAGTDYSLYFVSRPDMSKRGQYVVLPVSTPDAQLSAKERAVRNQFVSAARAMFARSNKGVTERPIPLK